MDPARSAAKALKRGELVVFPTDTLLGLAARASDDDAVARLERIKERSPDQPVSVAVSSLPDLEALTDLGPAGLRFARTHLPGAFTLIARPSALARRTLAPSVFAKDGTIGVRLPDHPVARELARQAGPITATSANLHGQPPCRTLREARRVFGPEVAVYLAPRPRGSGRPSTLVDVSHGKPKVIDRS
jgi:L-threonylcarbamoyladenylate synthase